MCCVVDLLFTWGTKFNNNNNNNNNNNDLQYCAQVSVLINSCYTNRNRLVGEEGPRVGVHVYIIILT